MCEYCHKTYHTIGCPNYTPPSPTLYCCICGADIACNEEYIEDNYGEIAHIKCFTDIGEILNWLGYEIKSLEGDD